MPRPSSITTSNKELIKLYNIDCLSPTEIVDTYGFNYRGVINKLKELGVFKRKKNDKNKDKYQKNHTQESYRKMQETIIKQYENGRTAWNKGVTENESPSVKIQAEGLRKHHHNNGSGENNTRWDGGPKGRILAQILKKDIIECELCKSTIILEVHHKDKNPNNNDMNNLVKVCSKCHHTIHMFLRREEKQNANRS